MQVGVIEPGQGQLALQVDDLGVFAGQFPYLFIFSHRDELAVADGRGLRPGLGRVRP